MTDLLPTPFEWCDIPAGKVTIEYLDSRGKQIFDVPRFQIAKYPITTAQFQVFVDDEDGYRNVLWWDYSEAASAWRAQNRQPQNPLFGNIADYPRTNVTWYEAVAFCRWLDTKMNPTPDSSCSGV